MLLSVHVLCVSDGSQMLLDAAHLVDFALAGTSGEHAQQLVEHRTASRFGPELSALPVELLVAQRVVAQRLALLKSARERPDRSAAAQWADFCRAKKRVGSLASCCVVLCVN